MKTHEDWMNFCLRLAKKAAKLGEIPVGACLVDEKGELISSAYNLRETLQTPLGHAELLALHKAAKKKQNWRLENTTLYVTLEPCIMCMGVLLQSRVPRVVYGTKDPKGGAAHSLYELGQDPRLNHRLEISGGVLENECSQILKSFFKKLRIEKKASLKPEKKKT